VALTSPALLWLLSAALLLSVVWLIRATGWARLAPTFVLLCLVPGLLAAAVNDHFQYWTAWRDLAGLQSRDLTSSSLQELTAGPGGPTLAPHALAAARQPTLHGRLARVRIHGALSGITRGGLVYLPPQYFLPAWRAVRFPVLELLSGSPGTPEDWINALHADLAADHAAHHQGPMIVVIPDTNGSRFTDRECQDSRRGPDETYLTSDLRAWLGQRVRVRADAKGWLLAGYSTGGYCAVNLLDHHPRQYGGAASLDGYFTAIQDRYTGNLYGGSHQRRSYNDPARQWRHEAAAPGASLLLLTGQRDDSLDTTLAFARELAGYNGATLPARVDVHVGVQAGAGHNFSSWRTMLPTVYAWAWTNMQTPLMERLLAQPPVPPLPQHVELAPPGCQTPNGGLRNVAVCKGHRGHHWYRTTPPAA
jgi:enterochelin esterase-like enzyme